MIRYLYMDKKDKFKKIAEILVSSVFVFGVVFYTYIYFLQIEDMNNIIRDLDSRLTYVQDINLNLYRSLVEEQKKNGTFEKQIGEIFGTVGTLNKLVNTDKELLMKYSKVYFLNEHYVPDELSEIPEKYLYEEKRDLQIHSKVLPNLLSLIDDAKKERMDLKVISAYRSFGEQSVLKTGYSVVYGSGANKFSADQGYSEHQLGTTVDFTTSKTGSNFSEFKNTKEYDWLTQNAYRYGFIISYPEDNQYYEFEPWHWRFVGKNLAKRINEDKTYFYNLSQSIIDDYLVSIFD